MRIPIPAPPKILLTRKQRIIVGVLLLLIVPLVIVGLAQTSRLPSQPAGSGLPIPADDPTVKTVIATYVFNGEVKDVITTPKGTYLFITPQGSPFPPLPITYTTKVVIKSNEQTLDAVVANIKKGNIVSVQAAYDAKRKTWNTHLIEIIIP